MAISFPLPLADFFTGIVISSLELDLNIPVEYSQDEGGNMYRNLIGTPLWTAAVEISPHLTKDADRIRSRIHLLRTPEATLLVSPKQRKWPGYYDSPAIFTGSNPVVGTINSNRVEFNINGLPANSRLIEGDYISITYGTNPVRYSFHQVVTGRVANGSGVAGPVEVVPYLPQGVAAGAAVTVVNPFFKAVMQQGSGGRFLPKHNTGMSLMLQQVVGR